MAARVAGRGAEELGFSYSLVAHTGARQLLEPINAHSFHGENRSLCYRSATSVVADLAIGPNHAMARDEIRDRVVGQGGAHRPHRGRVPDLACDPPVRAHLAARDLVGLTQDGLLEVSEPAEVEAHPVLAAELVIDLGRQVSGWLGRHKRPADVLLEELLESR